MTFFDASDVLDAGQIENSLLFAAENTSFVQFKEALLFVNDDALDLAAIAEDDTQDHDANRNHILPPMTTTGKTTASKTTLQPLSQ